MAERRDDRSHTLGSDDGSDNGDWSHAKIGNAEPHSSSYKTTKTTTSGAAPSSTALTTAADKRPELGTRDDKDYTATYKPRIPTVQAFSGGPNIEKKASLPEPLVLSTRRFQPDAALSHQKPYSEPTKSEREHLRTTDGGAERENITKAAPEARTERANASRVDHPPRSHLRLPEVSSPISASGQPRHRPPPLSLLHLIPPAPPRKPLKIRTPIDPKEAKKPRVEFVEKEKPRQPSSSSSWDGNAESVLFDRDRARPDASTSSDETFGRGNSSATCSSEHESQSIRSAVVSRERYERLGDTARRKVPNKTSSSEAPPPAVRDKDGILLGRYAERVEYSYDRRPRKRLSAFGKRNTTSRRRSRKRRRICLIIGGVVLVVLVALCVGLGVYVLTKLVKAQHLHPITPSSTPK